MAAIEMKNIVKKYGDGFPAVNDVSIDVADGEFMILVGSVRMREVHPAADDRGSGGHHQGRDGHRRQGRQRPGPARPQPRDGLPELRPLPAPDRLREHRVPAAAGQGVDEKTIDEKVREASQDARARRAPGAQARQPVGWPAPAGRDGAGDRARRRRRSSSTSRCPTSTPSCAARCAPRSRGCRSSSGITTVYVTHDQTEAMTLGDRVAVLKRGRAAAARHTARALRATRSTCSWPASSVRRR